MVVEFGTFVGTSALAWGATVRDLHGSDAADLRVYAFELDPKHAQIARDFVTLASLDDVVTVLDGPGDESLKKLYAEGKVVAGKVDVVFLDHWKDAYLPDLKLLEELKLFHPGSVVIADNTDIPGAPGLCGVREEGRERGERRCSLRDRIPGGRVASWPQDCRSDHGARVFLSPASLVK